MDGQKSEKPTQKRLEKARKEGNLPTSREFVSGVQFLVFVALLVAYGGVWFYQVLRATRELLGRAFTTELTSANLIGLVHSVIVPETTPLLGAGFALVAAVLFLQMATTGFGIAGKKLMPDFNRLNPLKKIQGLPGQTLPIFLQALVLLPLVGYIVYYEISENLDQLLALPWMSVQGGVLSITGVFRTLFWRVSFLFLIVGLIDLVWQRRRYTNQLKMTKHEVREESKEQQGNPHIKMRIRRLQRDYARRKMMQEVPKATAVIVNPTHYAVAIRYAIDSGGAPKVVAKGKNHLALKIRQMAVQHQVPIVENPPLARALYKSAEVGQEIPADLYRAVAEILAYIYRLMNGRLPG